MAWWCSRRCYSRWRHDMETFRHHWPFVWGVRRGGSPRVTVVTLQTGAMMFTLVLAWTSCWTNGGLVGVLWRYKLMLWDSLVVFRWSDLEQSCPCDRRHPHGQWPLKLPRRSLRHLDGQETRHRTHVIRLLPSRYVHSVVFLSIKTSQSGLKWLWSFVRGDISGWLRNQSHNACPLASTERIGKMQWNPFKTTIPRCGLKYEVAFHEGKIWMAETPTTKRSSFGSAIYSTYRVVCILPTKTTSQSGLKWNGLSWRFKSAWPINPLQDACRPTSTQQVHVPYGGIFVEKTTS